MLIVSQKIGPPRWPFRLVRPFLRRSLLSGKWKGFVRVQLGPVTDSAEDVALLLDRVALLFEHCLLLANKTPLDGDGLTEALQVPGAQRPRPIIVRVLKETGQIASWLRSFEIQTSPATRIPAAGFRTAFWFRRPFRHRRLLTALIVPRASQSTTPLDVRPRPP